METGGGSSDRPRRLGVNGLVLAFELALILAPVDVRWDGDESETV